MTQSHDEEPQGEMSEDDFQDESDLLDEDDFQDEDDRSNEAVAGVGAWGISFVLHAIALLSLLLIVFLREVPEKAPVQIVAIEAPPPPEEEEKVRDIIEKEVTVEVESDTPVENPTVTELDLPVEEIETEDEVVSENPAKGREEAVSSSEMGGAGAFMAIGAGGGAAGAFGNRNGGGRKRAVGRFGGSKASESAVEAALRWFARHQSPNGMWDVDGYPQNCTLPGVKCEPGQGHTGNDGDVACTGYALLCFLGAGYDHKTPNKWRKTVKAGIDYLVSAQEADGALDNRNYAHAIAVMALAEAYAMTNDPTLKNPTQRGVDVILERQTYLDDGYPIAWNYKGPDLQRQDSSVTGWNVMALKSAKAGGLSVGQGMQGGKRWLEATWKAANPDWQKLDGGTSTSDRSWFPYIWNPTSGAVGKDKAVGEGNNTGRESIGLLCGVFLGYGSGNVMMETMANEVMAEQVPTGFPMNTYYMYYNTLAVFQMGGERWRQWNNTVRDILVNAQRKDDNCFDGSWDWKGNQFHGTETGRLLHTAYCCLSLEVYYRYLPVAAQKK